MILKSIRTESISEYVTEISAAINIHFRIYFWEGTKEKYELTINKILMRQFFPLQMERHQT